MLIGGYAVGYHGYPPATADMDIWIAIQPSNATRVVAALKEFGFDVPELRRELFLQEDQIVRMGVPPVRIKIVTTISGVEFDDCCQERVVDELGGVLANLISRKHLKINKKSQRQAPRHG